MIIEYIRESREVMATAAAEIARLRAIEAAAREYRTAYQRDDIWGDEWTIACVEHRSRLFALLDSCPPA